MGTRISISFLILFATVSIWGQAAPTNNAKILVMENNGAYVTTYGAVKTDIQAGAVTAHAAGMTKSSGTAFVKATAGTDYSDGTASLATGIVKTTTGTGALTIAVASDFPILNQNTTGTAAAVTTNANLTGPVTSVGNATTITAGAIGSTQLATGSVDLASNKVTGLLPNANLANNKITLNGVDRTLGSSTSLTLQDAIAAGGTATSAATFGGGITVARTTQTMNSVITGTVTLASTDNARVIKCTANCTVNIPSLGSGSELHFIIDKTNVGVVSFASSGETIDALSTYTVTNSGATVKVDMLKAESTNWAIKSSF
jgi:hypothetical protein